MTDEWKGPSFIRLFSAAAVLGAGIVTIGSLARRNCADRPPQENEGRGGTASTESAEDRLRDAPGGMSYEVEES